jgi:hypothetical protein
LAESRFCARDAAAIEITKSRLKEIANRNTKRKKQTRP